MLQQKIVDPSTFELIQRLQEKEYLRDFLLVGGTALALQIGHRKSVDIDLFTTQDFDSNVLIERLESDFPFYMDSQGHNTATGSIKGVKIDLMAHKYPLLAEPITEQEIRLASLLDIVAMKLNAISGNGTRVKDFIDLYFLLTIYSVADMIRAYEQKYSTRSSYHALKSLNYFDEVRLEDWPDMMGNKLTWKTVKTKINKEVVKYSRSLIRTNKKTSGQN
jgi:hypothetical protein